MARLGVGVVTVLVVGWGGWWKIYYNPFIITFRLCSPFLTAMPNFVKVGQKFIMIAFWVVSARVAK